MKASFPIFAALLLAAPGAAQTVSTGIDQWQKGQHEAAVATWTPLAAQGDADAAEDGDEDVRRCVRGRHRRSPIRR